jgi:hypothetical protein
MDLDEQPEDSEWWMTAVASARAFGNDFFKVLEGFKVWKDWLSLLKCFRVLLVVLFVVWEFLCGQVAV